MAIQKCIWMECGYIEYKLCDRNYDCENCPFDKAIHEKDKSTNITNKNEIQSIIKSKIFNIEKTFITKNHVWFRKVNGVFAFGIDNFIQRILKRNIKFHLPELSSIVIEKKPFVWLTGKFGGIGFPAPFNGKVTYVNNHLLENPSLFFDTNSFHIELIEVEAEDHNISHVYPTETFIEYDNYHNFIANEKMQVNDFLNRKVNKNIGITMYDGGEINFDTIQNLPDEEYFQLLKLLIIK